MEGAKSRNYTGAIYDRFQNNINFDTNFDTRFEIIGIWARGLKLLDDVAYIAIYSL